MTSIDTSTAAVEARCHHLDHVAHDRKSADAAVMRALMAERDASQASYSRLADRFDKLRRDKENAIAISLKELEWKGVGDTIHASAYGIDRAYLIEGNPGNWSLRYVGNRQEESVDGYDTQAAAKQAAWDIHRDKAASQLTTLPAAHAAQTLLEDPGAILVGHEAMAEADDEDAPDGKPDYDELLTAALTAIRANCA